MRPTAGTQTRLRLTLDQNGQPDDGRTTKLVWGPGTPGVGGAPLFKITVINISFKKVKSRLLTAHTVTTEIYIQMINVCSTALKKRGWIFVGFL